MALYRDIINSQLIYATNSLTYVTLAPLADAQTLFLDEGALVSTWPSEMAEG
jgi:hypothetical protein